jgi:hypothetical protein
MSVLISRRGMLASLVAGVAGPFLAALLAPGDRRPPAKPLRDGWPESQYRETMVYDLARPWGTGVATAGRVYRFPYD